MRVISVREHPAEAPRFIDYFVRCWGSPETEALYRDCIENCLTARFALPQWYLLVDEAQVICGGVGLITNDFISRMDLLPWLCALHVEPAYRGRGHGARLIEHVAAEAARLGFERLYLCTDHTGYYEKHRFTGLGMGHHPWGAASRIYQRLLSHC